MLAACLVLAAGLLAAGNGSAGLHAAIFLAGAAGAVAYGLDLKAFIGLGIAGLLTCGLLLIAGAARPAEKLGDVSYLALVVGVLLTIIEGDE